MNTNMCFQCKFSVFLQHVSTSAFSHLLPHALPFSLPSCHFLPYTFLLHPSLDNQSFCVNAVKFDFYRLEWVTPNWHPKDYIWSDRYHFQHWRDSDSHYSEAHRARFSTDMSAGVNGSYGLNPNITTSICIESKRYIRIIQKGQRFHIASCEHKCKYANMQKHCEIYYSKSMTFTIDVMVS